MIHSTRVPIVAAALALTLLAAGCSKSESAGITQAVAKVNKEEITELQVNQVLERQRNLKPEQVDAASQRVVSALVDQEILYQKAKELKLDRDPRVVQAIESARRELVSRAYLERIADGTAAPSADEIRAYFDSKPALFQNRRIYSLQELTIETSAVQRAEVETQMKALKTSAELEKYLKEKNLRVRSERTTLPAENLPMALVDRLATLRPGSGVVLPAPAGMRVIYVSEVQEAPVTLDQTKGAIENFILADRKRQTIDKELQALRTASTVEYLGKFKGMAASAPATGTAITPSPSQTPVVTAPASSSPSAMDSETLNKGMSGLK